MAARSFNARNGVSVGTTPTEIIASNGAITSSLITATTLNVTGDMTVSGTTTYVNTTTLNVGDNIVTLNADVTGAPTENAGIEIRRGTSANVAVRWNETNDWWELTENGTNYGRIRTELDDITLGTETTGNYVASVSSGTTAITIGGTAGEGWTPSVSIRSATTAQDGIVQLTDSVSSTSTTTAATPNAVKSAYDLASSRVSSVGSGNGLTGGPITSTGTLSVVANNGIVANSTGVFVNAGNGLVANATGVHMPTVATAGSSTGGISAVTIDAQGRVTSVTGSAGYVTSSGVTSVATANGIAGGTITGTGTIYAVAGATLVANSTGIHMPNVATAGSSTGGISAITIDAQGRVTSVTGSAGYGPGTVTSVTGGSGLTGSITTSGSLAVGAGVGITVNADDVAVNAQSGLLANSSGLYVNASSIALGTVPSARLPSGTTGATGIVQLTDSVSSTSTTTAATPNSVKTAYDLANGKAATNQTMYIGTTAVAINRGSAAISLTGTSIDGSAGSVAWTNVTGRPTAVSSFTNDSGYITSSGQSVNKYAALRYSYSYDYGTQYSPGTGFSYSSSGAKNISSLTWNGDGDITINFTNAFADANYKAFLQAPGDSTHAYTGIKSQTTSSCRATTKYTANSSGGQFFLNPGYTHNFVALEFA